MGFSFCFGFLRLNASFVCQLPDASSSSSQSFYRHVAVCVSHVGVCESVCGSLLNCLFMFARRQRRRRRRQREAAQVSHSLENSHMILICFNLPTSPLPTLFAPPLPCLFPTANNNNKKNNKYRQHLYLLYAGKCFR